MADQEQLAILKQGVPMWNKWREVHLNQAVDLTHADLSGAELSRADLSRAALFSANLRDADLYRTALVSADLYGADLTHADLSGADLTGADLSHADLTDANMSNAQLQNAKFVDVTLNRANLSSASLLATIFVNVNLNSAKGLESCAHGGPSSLDHQTLSRSGSLPLVFLRGCGLPDRWIEFLPSILNEAIQFYSCFISYSKQDQQFADRLYADLQNKGVRCWFAPHDIQGGKKVHEQIDEAIRLYDKLLLILSRASMDSDWVKTEIAHARQKEVNQKHRVLFPISLVPFDAIKGWKDFDADIGKDSAKEVREYFIPDFGQWKIDHDAYSKAFERLLKDLRSEKAPGT